MSTNVENDSKGARLEFCVRKATQPVRRTKTRWDADTKRIVTEVVTIKEDAFILYLPNGHAYRLTLSELIRKGFDRQPNIINLDKVTDTKSHAGKFKFARNDADREKAWRGMEDQLIKKCIKKAGPVDVASEPHLIDDQEAEIERRVKAAQDKKEKTNVGKAA